MAKTIDKTASDRVVLLSIGNTFNYPFTATDWVDLRAGFFLSLTKALVDDDPTGLAETIGVSNQLLGPKDRYWIGAKKMNAYWPTENTPGSFLGFTNHGPARTDYGPSVLVSSDLAVGTSNAFYWRPGNSEQPKAAAMIMDTSYPRATSPEGVQQHFPQDVTGAGGYCVLLALQLLRPDPKSRVVTLRLKSQTHSTDLLYTSAPSNDLLVDALKSWTTNTIQIGPVELSQVPDGLFCYWPFKNSRLRVHGCGVVKANP